MCILLRDICVKGLVERNLPGYAMLHPITASCLSAPEDWNNWIFTFVIAMLLVVLQAAKIKIHFGVLLLSVLLPSPRINHDMLWYTHIAKGVLFYSSNSNIFMTCLVAIWSRVSATHWISWFAVLWVLTCTTVFTQLGLLALALLLYPRWAFYLKFDLI